MVIISTPTMANEQDESRNLISKPPPINALAEEYMKRHAKGKFMTQSCYRHKQLPNASCKLEDVSREAELEAELSKLSNEDAAVIKTIWQTFQSAPGAQRGLILKGLLNSCCFPQLSDVASTVRDLVRMDILTAIPIELAFKVLGYLDAKSLVNASQVSKAWRMMADDDVVWYHICEQHIDRKCTTCGWGLPLLDRRRLRKSKKAVMERLETLSLQGQQQGTCPPGTSIPDLVECAKKRRLEASFSPEAKRRLSESSGEYLSGDSISGESSRRTKPWKEVYFERFKVEHNWRTGKHLIKEFNHDSAVLCLQFDHQYLITGSYEGHVTIWDIDTQVKLRVLKSHFRAVSALKFDGTKLVTGSWDQSVRVWNYHTGQCLCTFGGIDSKVLCIDFDKNLIVAGTADASVKVWDFHEKSCFTLRGHTGPIYSVRIHAASSTLYTSSGDLTVRMWDIRTKQCLKVFCGPENGLAAHNAQIQQVLPLTLEHLEGEEDHHLPADVAEPPCANTEITACDDEAASRRPTHLLTASLDNTIKVWDIRTGRCARTLFGHVEGVWCMAADHFRIVSGALDKLVKVWDVQSGRCWHTFSGHSKPICCVGLSDTGFASGGEDGKVILHNYDT